METLSQTPETQAFYSWLRKSITAFVIGVGLFIYGLIGPTDVQPGWNQFNWIIVGIITFFVMWYSGGHFFSGTIKAIKAHKANMYTLIAVATGPAWLYSFIISLFPNIIPLAAREVHYDVPLSVIGLIVFGSVLEKRATLKSLAKVQSLESLKISENVADLQRTIEVKPEEMIPMDGIVVEGQPVVDESWLSAERTHIQKRIGDTVFAGSINRSSLLRLKTTAVGEESALRKIIAILKQAQHSRPSIGNISDKVAAWFAPFVLLLAIVTPLIWYNWGPEPQITYMLITSIAVLLIACPCALGLATQISITAGISKAADFGIFFRQGDAVQDSKQLTTIMIEQANIVTDEQNRLKPQVKSAIEKLQAQKIKIILLSHQNEKLVGALAAQLGIEQVIANVETHDKVKLISEQQGRGEKVGYVNDGKDDKPLQQADVGFAVGTKAYLAEKADSVMLSESLYGLVNALRVSKAIMRNIKQNLIAAFIYNVVGLPLAAGVFYPLVHELMSPIIAGALMASSSFGVVINANRLLLLKAEKET